jgi:tetraacyldisaccharide 4'-kinase
LTRPPSWLWRASESAAQRAWLAPLLPLEAAYRAGVWLHRRAYESGWRERVRLPARVVAVGNLAVGGSGKTPLVAWLASRLAGGGRKVAVLCRGVGGRAGDPVNVVSDGERMLEGAERVGDEAVWLAGAAPGVPVLAGRNRAALGLRALSVFGSEVLLLDDGFQHWRLERDVDLVCLDARLGIGNGHVLPRGPLREPASGLTRAHALVWTRAHPGEAEPACARSLPRSLPRFRVEIAPKALRDVASGERVELSALAGRRVGLLAAIARPDRLRADLERMGARVERERTFADHHAYRPRDVESLDAELLWVTTAKDAVKLPVRWLSRCPLWVLEEEVRPQGASQLLEWLARRLDAPRGPA